MKPDPYYIQVSNDSQKSASEAPEVQAKQVAWLHLGLNIEQKQYVFASCFFLAHLMCGCERIDMALHTRTSEAVTEKQRSELQDDVDSFLASAPFTWSHPSPSPPDIPDDEDASSSDGSDWLSDDLDSEDEAANVGSNPEKAFLPLPSQLGNHYFEDPIIAALATEEKNLRVKQASEALQQLRLSLGLKSALFKTSVAPAKSQKTKTRAWRGVKTVETNVRRYAKLYRGARQALLRLGAATSVMEKFPDLKKEDLKMSRDVVEENRVGQKSDHVPWIWRIDCGLISDQDTLLQESEHCFESSCSIFH